MKRHTKKFSTLRGFVCVFFLRFFMSNQKIVFILGLLLYRMLLHSYEFYVTKFFCHRFLPFLDYSFRFQTLPLSNFSH